MNESTDWNQMYKYIGKGNTIYDYLSDYLPELNGDFSTENLIANYNLIREKSFGKKYNSMPELGDSTNRQMILAMMYTYVRTNLKEKFTEEERLSGEVEEWERMEFIRALINSPKKFQEYEEYLAKAQPRLEQVEKKEKTKIMCEALRKKVVRDQISSSLSGEQKERYDEEGISVLFPETSQAQMWKQDRAEWFFIKYAKPEVVATSPVIYSKGGMENQIVTAVSYGKVFLKNGEQANYGSDISTDSLFCQPDLVGVTKIGRDGISTYFVVMPLETVKFSEQKADPSKDEKDIFLFLNGKKADMVNEDKKRVFAINTGIIQPDTMDGYLQVLFSDEYLEGVRKYNGGYAGYVAKSPSAILGEDDDKSKFQIVTSDIGRMELEGTRFAFNNPGSYALSKARKANSKGSKKSDPHRIGAIYGERQVDSLEKVCEELSIENLRLVKEITNGEFDFSGREDDISPEKPEGPVGQEPFDD